MRTLVACMERSAMQGPECVHIPGFRCASSGLRSLPFVILCAKRGAIAGVAAGHADVNLMSLTDRQRRRGDCGFERRFLGGKIALDIAVVEHAPMIAYGDHS